MLNDENRVRSFMNIVHNNGPRHKPWETPEVVSNFSEVIQYLKAYCVVFD